MADFKNKEIKYQITVLMAIMIILVVIAMVLVLVQTNQQLKEQNEANVKENIQVIENRIENILTELSYVANSLALHDGVAEMAWQVDSKKNVDLYQNVLEYMFDLLETTESISNIGFVGYDGTFYNLGFNRNKNKVIEDALSSVPKGTKLIYMGVVESVEDETRELLFVANIYDAEQTIETIGYVILLVSDDYFIDTLDATSGNYYLVDEKNHVILSIDDEMLGAVIDIEDSVMGNSKWSLNLPLNVVASDTEVRLTENIIDTGIIYMLLIGLMLLILLVIYIFLDRRITRPMGSLSEFIQELSQGDLNTLKKRIHIVGSKEVHDISDELNEMLDEINRLTNNLVETTSQLYIKEIEKKEAELNLLKSQINPHFLYNTLGVIRGIAIMRDENEIKVITSALVKILRYSIKGHDLVDFEEELAICKAYIEIQKIRFEDRFDVSYDFEVDMTDIIMLKMILQPLVENAIVHGIEASSRKSQIVIGTKHVTDGIQVYVQDDGVGIEKDKLGFINQQLQNETSSAWLKEHVGLLNVHTRLKHMWGTGLSIDSEIKEGTTISFIIHKND